MESRQCFIHIENYITATLVDEGNVVTLVARGKASLKDKDRFVAKLYKLFYILNYNRQIITCSEKNCS